MNNYTTNLYGSNFRTGFTAGRMQIPTEISPGVPVGLPISYTIRQPNYRQRIHQVSNVSLTTDPYFVPISKFSPTVGTIMQVDTNNRMYKFDYSRLLAVSLRSSTVSTNVNVFISYFDMYGNKGFYKIVLDTPSESFLPTICCLGISSIYITSDAPTEVFMEFEMQDTFELPYTDNGLQSQLLLVSGNKLDENHTFNALWVSTTTDTESFAFSWDGNYIPALTTPPTEEVSLVRPRFEILNGGEPMGEEISNFVFSFQQNVYGLGNGTQFNNPSYPNIGTQTLEGKYIFGQPNYSKGFVSWKG